VCSGIEIAPSASGVHDVAVVELPSGSCVAPFSSILPLPL
jgi:hypothetical protein